MTISSLSNRASFTANGISTSFPVAFPFQMQADLVVLLVDASGNQVVQTLGSAYSITGSQDSSGFYPNGGNVVFTVAPASGSVVIYRDPALTQLTVYTDNDPLPAASLQNVVDKLTMLVQRSRDLVGRTLRQPDGDTTAVGAIPPAATRANGGLGSYMGFDSAGNPTVLVPAGGQAAVSVAMAPVVTAASLSAGIGALLPGTPNVTEDTAPDAAADLLLSWDTDAAAAKSVRPVSLLGAALGFALLNGDLVASVAASALTIAIKTTAGNDPSAADPVYVVFRNATATLGTKAVLKITAATSLVVPAAATLGTVNNTPFRLWVVGFNDAGTFRLGVINNVSGTDIFPLRDGIQSATNPVGNSAQTLYAGAAVASKAMRILGFMEWQSGLATAGTWSAGPDLVSHFHNGLALPGTVVQSVMQETGALATGTNTTPMPGNNTIPTSSMGDQFMSKAITPTAKMNVLEMEMVIFGATAGTGNLVAALYQDATANALVAGQASEPSASQLTATAVRHKIAAGTTSATTIKARMGGTAAGATTLNGSGGTQVLGGVMGSSLKITEIMA